MSLVSSNIGNDKSKVVYIGNIAFEATDQQVIELFRHVGRVVAYKPAIDKETGRQKGYAYCEFMDAETAQSAIRHLNDNTFCNRKLKVAEISGGVEDKTSSSTAATRQSMIGSLASSTMTPAQVTSVLQQLTPQQQVDILAELKSLAQQNPTATRQLFLDSPQLATALLQLQIMYGFLNANTVREWQAAGQQAVAAPAPPAAAPKPAMPPPAAMPAPPPHSQYPPAPPQYPPHVGASQYPPAPPPAHAAHPGAPPRPPQAMPPPADSSRYPPEVQRTITHLSALSEPQRAAFREALKMTPEQLSALPNGQQLTAQVQLLRGYIQQGYRLPL